MRNPFSLEAFADWLGQQPANKKYFYTEPNECAVAQYLRSLGFDNVSYDARSGTPHEGEGPHIPRELFDVANTASCYCGIGTFGDAFMVAQDALASAQRDWTPWFYAGPYVTSGVIYGEADSPSFSHWQVPGYDPNPPINKIDLYDTDPAQARE